MVLPFIVVGLTTGAIYGLAGVGLVLTYRVTGLFNFAYGAIATAAAYLFYTLHVTHAMAWPAAALITIGAVSAVFAVGMELLARAVSGARLVVQVATTVGVLLLVQALVVLLYGVVEVRIVPVFLAEGSIELAGTVVQKADLVTVLIAVGATALLYLFFRFTRAGAAMRAVVENPELVELTGRSATRIRRGAWFLGTLFAAGSGVLLSSLLPLNATTLTLLVVQAFAAAAVGGFSSLPLTFGGGLLIGVLASLSTKWFTTGFLAGLPPAIPFIVLFVVLLLFPKRYGAAAPVAAAPARTAPSVPWRVQAVGGLALLASLASVPAFAGVHIVAWTSAVALVIVFLSLGMLVRTSGQVSLCHVGFMAIGAAALGRLTQEHGLPWGVALVAAGLIAVPIGCLLAIPAIRLSGLHLALATFGFGVVLSFLFYTQDFMFGNTGAGIRIPRPAIATSDEAYYYFVLVLAALATAVVLLLNFSRLGRLLRGLAESSAALTTNGTSVNVTRVLVFSLSAGMAAVGGALAAAAAQQADSISYPPLLSLTYFALVLVIGGREPWYAVVCALGLGVIPSYVSDEQVSTWLQLVAAVAVLAYAGLSTVNLHLPVPARLRVAAGRQDVRDGDRATTAPPAATSPAPAEVAPGVLEGHGLSVRFGGVHALDDVSLAAPTGQITGLVGPNGAGKTTLFNVLSGLQRAQGGKVTLDGRDISRSSPQGRSRKGLGRTFQRMELFDSQSVWANVSIGAEGRLAGNNPVRHVLAHPRESENTRASVEHALRLCGIEHLAQRTVGSLSTGQRRVVELARLLAGSSRILLLDEPSSGLDRAETQEFADILRRAVAERGVGILLVEHDMDFVMELCSRIYVLNFGQMIFDGPPAEVRSSPLVQAAYLGVPTEDEPAGVPA